MTMLDYMGEEGVKNGQKCFFSIKQTKNQIQFTSPVAIIEVEDISSASSSYNSHKNVMM